MSLLYNILKLLRLRHWLKNLLVFVALFFTFNFEITAFVKDLLAFFGFSLFASSVYILNDMVDSSRDRQHPKKKHRPIAAGKIKIWQALLIFVLVFSAGTYIVSTLNQNVLFACLFYFAMNLLYSFWLKHTAIIDVMIIALGFVIRVIVGAYAISVPVSHWILLCTFFISLFLAFGKRKNEMEVLEKETKAAHRKSIAEYNQGFINQMLSLTAGISVVFYALYTIDPSTIERFGSNKMIYSTPIVVFAVFRYFHMLYNKNDGGDPVTIFLEDKQFSASVVLWLLSIILIYYFS